MGIINDIISYFTSSNETKQTSGAAAVRKAVGEVEDLTEGEFSVTLGEPDIVQRDGEFFNDPKVVVPVFDGPFGENQRLVFDLPASKHHNAEQFNQLLEIFGLDFETMEEMVENEVPVQFVGGNLVVDWNQMDAPDDGEPDKGAEETSDSPVNVEETTIGDD